MKPIPSCFRRSFLLVVFILGFLPSTLSAEEITVTTYYPSPEGKYKKLETTDQTLLATDTTSETARVGIGTTTPQAALDVNGGVKLGNVATCTADVAGLMRYNGIDIQYCDSTGSWQAMGGSGQSYVHWGDTSCASGYDVLYTGYMYHGGQNNGLGSGFVCSTGRRLKIFEVNVVGTSYEWVFARPCAECAQSGARFCYTKWGDTTCAVGFHAVYTGFMYQGGQNYGYGSDFVCSSGTQKKTYEWDYFTGLYSWWDTRPCAMCCKD